MKSESKHKAIKDHLANGGSLTGLQAIDLYGVYRLSSVISRLRRNENMPIETTMIYSGDNQTLFARYWIPINKR